MTSATLDPSLTQDRSASRAAFHDVLRTDGVRSVFQPIVVLATGQVAAYEALARGPVGPLERPDQLFAAAREAGLLAELDEACRRAAFRGALTHGLLAPVTLFVNVEPEVLDTAPLADLLDLAAAEPGELRVVLEITERALASQPAELLRTVRRVRELGWGIALDDVGADPASLAFMPLLRPDVVKLDLRLVQDQPSPAVAQIMNAVNAYAEESGALLLAEGIETEQHLATALALGATLGQGWLFGRPVAAPPALDPSTVRPLRLPHPPPASTEELEDSPFACLPIGTVLTRSPKGLLVELSKHLEREALRLGETCVVTSTFQHQRHFTPATTARYRRLAERTGFVCALGEDLVDAPAPGVRGATLAPGDPVLGEWDVVVLSPHYSAALVARDLGDTGPDRDRMFEYALTYHRDTAVRAARGLLARLGRTPAPPSSEPVVSGVTASGLRPAPRAVGDALVRRALAATTSGVTIADMTSPDRPLIFVNAAFENLAGYPADRLVGRNCRFLQLGRSDPATRARMRAALDRGEESRETLLNFRGPEQTPWWNQLHLSPVRDAEGVVIAYIGVQDDVTARVEAELALRQETERAHRYLLQLERLASTDSLTGLLNRRGFEVRAERALAEAAERGRAVALLFLDLDGFKRVNDGSGHAAGDGLLQRTAQRLADVVSEPDLLCRLGGDEFLVALTDLDAETAGTRASDVAAALSRAVAEPVELEGTTVSVTTSIGLSVSPVDAVDFGPLLHLADLRMYELKHPRQA